MKKLTLFLIAVVTLTTEAQTNLQIHYDFGQNRQYVTTTLEMFKADSWGNTFFFVDMDFNHEAANHPSLAYMEIARCLKTWTGPFSLHLEYNGGLGLFGSGSATGGYTIKNAYLIGLDYGLNNTDYTSTLNLKALYKRIAGVQHSAQLTAVWGLHWPDNNLHFTGFADLWLEKDAAIQTELVFISEPQLWYALTDHLSVGSEVELAVNFAGNKGLKICPTAGIKWIF